MLASLYHIGSNSITPLDQMLWLNFDDDYGSIYRSESQRFHYEHNF